MGTQHIQAEKNEIDKVVILIGDPLRVKYISEHLLENARLITKVYGLLGYSGRYNGQNITIMSSGMGLTSMSIIAYELFYYYDVDLILRVGTCGSYMGNILLEDIIVVTEAITDSNFNEGFGLKSRKIVPDFRLIEKINENDSNNFNLYFGKILSTNWFYRLEDKDIWRKHAANGILGVDNETYALYLMGHLFNKPTLSILTVSDSLIGSESLSADDRETKLTLTYKMVLDYIDRFYFKEHIYDLPENEDVVHKSKKIKKKNKA